ncbi:MAG: hypothetical protein K0Q53_93 [Massilibacillus sp.]|jgi:hypothetical protein|nr:hypothetical protein [Massilibacillus sp.]
MARNLLESITENLVDFQPAKEDATIDEIVSDSVQTTYDLFEKLKETSHDKNIVADLDIAANKMAAFFEQRGFNDGFAAGIKLVLQAALK